MALARIVPSINAPISSWRLVTVACVVASLALLVQSWTRGPACDTFGLLTLGVGAVVASVLFVRVPGAQLISILPVILLAANLACGWEAAFGLALLSFPITFAWTHRADTSLVVDVGLGLAGLASGVLVAALTAGLSPGLDPSIRRFAIGGGFMTGHAVGDALARLAVERAGLGSRVRATPRSNVIVNLLLVVPSVVLAGLLLDRDVVVFGAVLALLLASLALIGLYVGSETDRHEATSDRSRLRSIVDHAPDGIFAVGGDFSVEWLNDTAARQLGWEPHQAVGRPCGEVVQLSTAGGTPVDHREAFLRSAQSGLAIHTMGSVSGRDGRTFPVEVTYTAVVGDDGNVEVGVGSVRETPESLVLEDRAATLGHELRSPLTSILGYARLMQSRAESLDAPHRAEFVARIAESGDYMLRLVNNLLDLRRLESGAEELRFSAVDLSRLIGTALTMVQTRAAEKRIRLTSEVAPGIGAFTTDELLLRRAVDNLLSNAVKYTREGGAVHVVARRARDGVEVSVSDTGIGLTEEERAHLFERFYRSDRAEARGERGTGLGLVLVHETVRQLGGEIRVESAVSKGSTFTLWLPYRHRRGAVSTPDSTPDRSSVA